MSNRLPTKALLAVTAVALADGLLRKGEQEALVRAARACELSDEEVATVEAASKSSVDLNQLDLSDLTPWEQALTYALAYWLARVDGIVNSQELANLRVLEGKLTISEFKIRTAGAAVGDVLVLPGNQRPDKYDFALLIARLKEKLPQLTT